MSHTPHELHDEFPDDADLLREMKLSNGHFQKVSADYHEVNREIHRIEAEVEHASDDRLEDLKKRRLAMLDEVSKMIAKARASA
ncbi:MAG: DUF465 domain-containing protein [Sphingomonadaceae bacterium]